MLLGMLGDKKMAGIGRLRDEPPGGHTRLGHVMGTPGLMPPELFDRQAKLDERADVFMAGKLLQELMTFDPSGDPGLADRVVLVPRCPVVVGEHVQVDRPVVPVARLRSVRPECGTRLDMEDLAQVQGMAPAYPNDRPPSSRC